VNPSGEMAPHAARSERGEGLILAFGAAVVVASEFIVIGIAPAMARSLDLSLAHVGWFVTCFAIGSAVLGPIAVMAARRLRADHAMIVALVPFVAATVTPLIEAVWLISLLRLLQGAALPLFISVASDSLRRLWGRDEEAVARIYVGVVVGTVAAAPAGAAIADLLDWRTTFVGLGGLAALAMLLVLTRPSLRLGAVVAGGLGREAAVFLRPMVMLHLSLSLAQFAAMFCTYAFLAGVLEDVGVTKGAVGAWLLLFGLAGIVGNLAAGRACPAWMHANVLTTVAVLAAATAILPFLAPTPILLVPVLIGWGAAHAASFVICQLRVTRAAPQAPRLAAAMNISAANIGIATGSAIGGQLFEARGLVGLSMAGLILCALTLILAISARYSR
jgi:MFS transporter, DHA1 family, inner membrane transport protein